MGQEKTLTSSQGSRNLLESLGLEQDEIALTSKLAPQELPHEIVVKTWRAVLNKLAVESVLTEVGITSRVIPNQDDLSDTIGQSRAKEDNRRLRRIMRDTIARLEAPVHLAVEDRTTTRAELAHEEVASIEDAKQMLLSGLGGI